MKKPYKRPFVVFSILAILMFVALAVMVVLYPILFVSPSFSNLLPWIKQIYFNPYVFSSLFDFKLGLLFKIITLVIVGILAVLFLVLLFVAIFGIKKRVFGKIVGILIAVFGLAVAYFGGLVIVNCVYFMSPIYDVSCTKASSGDPGLPFTPVTSWAGWNGVYDIIMAKAISSQLVRFIVQIAMVLVPVFFTLFGILAIVNGVKYARACLVEDKEVVAEELPEPVEEPQPVEEPLEAVPEEMPVFMPEPEDEVVDPNNLSTTALAAIIKDVVREIVRDELERNNLLGKDNGQPSSVNNDSHTDNRSIVGATFGGPLIVQYFNGGIQSAAPAPAPIVAEVKPEPAPAPAPVEEPKPAPAPVEEPKPEPMVEEPIIVPVEEPKPEPVPEKEPKAPIVRIPFEQRLLASEKELQELYSELKNEILSYGVKSRVSSSGDTFRLHRKTYVKMTVAGKSLKLYFALNPDDYKDSPIPVQDASEKGIYAEIPLVFKVKSALSVRRCKQLIQDTMEKDGLEQGEIGSVNWIKELKAEMKARNNNKK